MLSKMDRDEDAIANFERALAIKPDYALARQNLVSEYNNRARLLLGTRDSDSRKYYLRATQLAPDDVEAHDVLARILATHATTDGGDPNRALREAQRACELTVYHDGLRLDTLALAYAAAGRFVDAVATEEKALRLITGSASPEVVNQLQAHLTLFRAGQPYRVRVPPAR